MHFRRCIRLRGGIIQQGHALANEINCHLFANGYRVSARSVILGAETRRKGEGALLLFPPPSC